MAAHDRAAALEPVTWTEPWGPMGEALDRLLASGQFVVAEPDMSEFVCADRRELQVKLDELAVRGIEPRLVRWRRRDGSIARHDGRPPAGWGDEATVPA